MVSEESVQSVGNWAGGAPFESQLQTENNGKWADSRRPWASCTKNCMDSAALWYQ